MPKILLVEDDLPIAAQIKDWLENDTALLVDVVNTGEDALQLVQSFGYDLIILDYGLPGMSGFDVCQKIRKNGNQTPIMFLTGQNHIDSKEEGFNIGADDYLTKPFELRELGVRCSALLRRSARLVDLSCYQGMVRLDSQSKCLCVEATRVPLSRLELSFLSYLMRHPDTVFQANEILKAVWPSDKDSSEEAVRSLVRGLRVKLAATNNAVLSELIETVPRLGYVIRTK